MSDSHATAPPQRSDGPPARDGSGGKSPYYILATSALADEHGLVLKQDDTFAVFDHFGDIKPTGLGEEGLYHEGTRYLSCLLLGLDYGRPMFLSSTVRQDNDLLTVDLTNPDISRGGAVVVPRGSLHLARTKVLWGGACHELLHLRNYGTAPVSVSLALHFEADFADIFEVRGTRRPRRGDYLPEEVRPDGVTLGYRGLDGVTRRTRLTCTPAPDEVNRSDVRFNLNLAPQGEATVELMIACDRDGVEASRLCFEKALAEATASPARARRDGCWVHASNAQFNAWSDRAAADVLMMTTRTPHGPYPYAGVPWFNCPFGRDGIITALECLWLRPELARGVLAYLAATQADAVVPEQDAEPGKILHETRRGEMAALKEIPFGRYYGSIDSTPLFVMLAGAYYERSGDRAFIESTWPNVEAALRWIDQYGDRDGDGFVDYARQSAKGLIQQGWKDSHDSVFHADGSAARGPIALCEVQGYVYAARRSAAALAAALGREQQSEDLWRQAEDLRERFEQAFWCDDIGTYALALDGDKKPCRVRTSNAGHCLFTGIAPRERARRTAQTLLSPESFSGWGVRTVAAGEVRYNPMSYHNGSVWPHDNALIAQGLAHYGLKEGVLRVMTGFYEASAFLDLHRLPELFCGFHRRRGEGPTLYPVACSPQAWSAAAPFLLLQACLGLDVKGPERQVCFHQPVLPPFLREVHISNLDVGGVPVGLVLTRHGDDVSINVVRREGTVEVRMVT
jgi:glycogen debranching enzyme